MTKEFKSFISGEIKGFINLKHSCGYSYKHQERSLKNFDRFLCAQYPHKNNLTKEIIDDYLAKKSYERDTTQKIRISIIRQLTEFLKVNGIDTYIPIQYKTTHPKDDFLPYIFSHKQIASLFKASLIYQNEKNKKNSSPLHDMMPIILRLLYSMGMRLNEVLTLKWQHINFELGTIRVVDAKFSKERLLPISSTMQECLFNYAKKQNYCDNNNFVFAKLDGTHYSEGSIYEVYRKILFIAHISHRGRGKGPRLHDLRHTFAMHNFQRWLDNKENISFNLTLLVDYLGHESLSGTQVYLRLLTSLFPSINNNMEEFIGNKLLEVFDEA